MPKRGSAGRERENLTPSDEKNLLFRLLPSENHKDWVRSQMEGHIARLRLVHPKVPKSELLKLARTELMNNFWNHLPAAPYRHKDSLVSLAYFRRVMNDDEAYEDYVRDYCRKRYEKLSELYGHMGRIIKELHFNHKKWLKEREQTHTTYGIIGNKAQPRVVHELKLWRIFVRLLQHVPLEEVQDTLGARVLTSEEISETNP